MLTSLAVFGTAVAHAFLQGEGHFAHGDVFVWLRSLSERREVVWSAFLGVFTSIAISLDRYLFVLIFLLLLVDIAHYSFFVVFYSSPPGCGAGC